MVQIVSLDLLKNILNVCKQHLTDEGYFKKTVVTIYSFHTKTETANIHIEYNNAFSFSGLQK